MVWPSNRTPWQLPRLSRCPMVAYVTIAVNQGTIGAIVLYLKQHLHNMPLHWRPLHKVEHLHKLQQIRIMVTVSNVRNRVKVNVRMVCRCVSCVAGLDTWHTNASKGPDIFYKTILITCPIT